MKFREFKIGELAYSEPGSFKIGPFGSSLKKEEIVKDGIPVLGIENVLDNIFTPPFRRNITVNKYKQLCQYTVKTGDILVTTMGTIGYAAVVPDNIGTAIIDSHLFRMRVDWSKVYPHYLCYGINYHDGIKRHLQQMSRGAIMDGLNTTILKECTLPLPSLPEQKRIVAILENADRLRRLQRYALELSGTYLQSMFLEMFGDPKTNSKGWDLKTLGDVIYSAQDGPHVSPDYSEVGIPFLSTRNIRPGQVIWEDLKFISREEAEKHWQKCKPQRGDILYTKGGTTGLAKAIDFDREIAVWVHIALLKPDNKLVDSSWLESMLNSDFCYNQSQEFTHGIANHDLGLTRMVKIKLYLPPLSLQREFVRIAKKYTRILAQQREAERQAEHLFQTLLHKAFQGELSLGEDEVLMPDVEMAQQQMPIFADVIEPINTADAFQLVLPME